MESLVEQQQERLRALVEAGIALTSELSLDAVLQKLVETAAALTGARYAALGVIDRTGQALESFLTTGMDPDTRAAIGDLPRGRGILGVLIREAEPLRLHDLGEDPRSVGFPPGHPPMQTFLGVPIVLRGAAYGNLYLTDKQGGEDFTVEDEELTLLLASQAAVAIENARLYESATRWLRQLEFLNEIGNALAGELDLPRLLELVARRLRMLVGARIVVIALPSGPDELAVEAADGEGAEDLLGVRMAVKGTKTGRVFERRRSERVDNVLDDPEVDQSFARRAGVQSAIFVPLLVRDRAIGVVLAGDSGGPENTFTEDDLRLAEVFAARAATAVQLSEQVTREALRRVVAAQELERRRLARELHDETGQALTSILLQIKRIEETDDPAELRTACPALRALVADTLRDVRRLAVELRPAALDDFGLVAALEHLAQTFGEQSGLQVDVEAGSLDERLPPEVETALYRIVQEALTNVAKHAGAARVSIVLSRKEGAVVAVVEDDGRGFRPDALDGEGLGIVGVRERIALLGGRVEIETAEGAGTTIVVEVPLR